MRRAGTYPNQRGLGREPHFDKRNVDYLISDRFDDTSRTAKVASVLVSRQGEGGAAVLLPPKAGTESRVKRAQSQSHFHYNNPWVGDQGNTPACTGFSCLRAWLAGPTTHAQEAHIHKTGLDELALAWYNEAVRIDRVVHGLFFDGGATMLAVAKAAVNLKYAKSYWWGYSLSDLTNVTLHTTPILGIDWPDGMDDPDHKFGIARWRGTVRGGHAIMVAGMDLDDGFFSLANNWGREWGVNGRCRVPFEDIEQAIANYGEILVLDEEPA